MTKLSGTLALLLLLANALSAQTAQIRGKVTDAQSGESLAMANILLGTEGTITDLNGTYTFQVNPGTYPVEVSYVGYKTWAQSVSLTSGQVLELNIQLERQATLLETATVSAGRFQKPLSEVTVSLEVLQPNLISSSNKIQLDDALQKIPGVSVIDGQANIRGGSGYAYGAGSRVLLLVDDIPILTADAGFPNWNDIPIENVGQVEVLKGASSALYGSSALNGVINFRTAWANLEPETKGSLFSTMTMNPKDLRNKWWDTPPLAYGAMVSHKQKLNKLDLVLSAFYLDEKDHGQETKTNYGRFNFNTRYRITDRLAFGLNGNFNRGDNQNFFYWQSDTIAYSPAPNTLAASKITRYNLDPHLTYFDKAGNRHKLLSRYFSVTNNNSDQRGNASRTYYGEYQFQRTFSKLQLVSTAGLVVSGSRVEAELYGDTTFTSRNIAAYVNLDQKIGERLNLSAGLRYENNLLKNPGFTYPKGVVPPSDERESKPVFRVGANYKLGDFTYARASWGQGYRYPTAAEKYIYTIFGGLSISPSPDLRSETGWSTEIGIKQGIKIGPFEGFADLSGFWMRYQDMMEFNFVDLVTGFQSVNIGGTEIKGIELSLNAQARVAGAPLLMTGGYLYIDPRFLDFDASPLLPGETPSIAKRNAINSSSTENVLKYRSRHSFKMDIEVQPGKWNIGVSVNYGSFQEAVDRVLLFVVPGMIRFRDANDKGFQVYDARVAYRFGEHAKVSLLLNNVLNEAYILRPGLMEAPRNLSLRVDWKL